MKSLSNFWEDEDGMGVVEVILIFKKQLTSIVKTIFAKITSNASSI